MRSTLAFTLAAVVIAAAGCGGKSSEDKAKDSFCNARADLKSQVDKLQSLTLSTATADGVKGSLNAIKTDLQKMANAQADLDKTRKAQAEQANQDFTSQVSSTLASIRKSTSLSQAATQLKAALQQLATTYKQTYAKIDCG
jgi:outer membrane murein-binding lipoprotein Lpp